MMKLLMTKLSNVEHYLSMLLVATCISQVSGNNLVCFNYCDDDGPGCFSITDLENKLSQRNSTNSTKVQLCSGVIELNTTLSVRGLQNLSITGITNKTVITCSGFQNVGLEFTQVENLLISNLNIISCGLVYNTTNTTQTMTSIHILNCTNVSITNTVVSNGSGSGIVFNNTVGKNTVTKSTFSNNVHVGGNVQNGGGIYIIFYCLSATACGASDYTFQDCNFTKNVLQSNYVSKSAVFPGSGRGGGMMILFMKLSSMNTISILDCLFQGNRAAWGSGINALFSDYSKQNRVSIKDTLFIQNHCTYAGGGIDIGLTWETHTNNFLCQNCTFVENSAKIGGGTAVYSVQGPLFRDTSLLFRECQWKRNIAQYGAAIDLTPMQYLTQYRNGQTPEPIFENCKFLDNIVSGSNTINNQQNFHSLPHYEHGRGTFLMTDFNVTFIGETEFSGNEGSAVYAISSDIQFETDSVSEFINNSGTYGGAIALIGLSAIVVKDNVSVILTNNTALNKGGAMFYFSLDNHDYVFSYNCFIRYQGEHLSSRKVPNVQFYFSDNKIDASNSVRNTSTGNGNSIYASTILPCFRVCGIQTPEEITIENAFKCLGDFIFNDSDLKISTSSSHFSLANKTNFETILKVIPGKIFSLPLVLLDDFNQTIKRGTYRLSIQNLNQSTITVTNSNMYISDNTIQLYGNIGDSGIITLTTTGFREISVCFEVEMQECPPLFRIETDYSLHHDLVKCVCTPNYNVSYIGLYKCPNHQFIASLRHGYWIGYTETETDKHLLYGYCPDTYCFNGQHNKRYHKLTTEASRIILDEKVCRESRTGVACGECRENYSVFYHSQHFKCEANDLCEIGWLFYILSEVLPLTLLFIIVMVFDISFTSGTLNGFIFFAQVFDSISDNSQGFILYSDTVHILKTIARTIYKLFNFDFFTVDQISYCLWKGATTMDILAFKFLTVVYALVLVFVTIWLTGRLGKCCNRRRKRSITRSVIHGLSAFLVMVHAQCTSVSFKILQFVHLFSHGSPTTKKTVVFYQGNIDYLSPRHLVYAIPALLCILSIVVLPPTILLSYPLCNRIIAFLKLDNWRIISWISRKIPMVRLKPMIDAFQGCFKDEYRYFAGLYFVYRIAFIVCTFATRVTQVYTILELLLLTILIIHALTWPYEKHQHNVVDGLIIFNLAIINTLSIFCYNYAQFGSQYQEKIKIASSVQLVFIYAPLVYILLYTITVIARKVKAKYCVSENDVMLRELWRDEDLPARLQDLSDTESETDYQLHREHNN